MKTFTLVSCKGTRTVECESLSQAIDKAKQMESRLQPAFGVTVEDSQGRTVAFIFDGEDV